MNQIDRLDRRHPTQSVLIQRLVHAAFVALLLLTACEKHRSEIHLTGATMGTQYSIKIVNPGEIESDVLKVEVDKLLSAINSTMSTYDPASELSELNHNPSTEWIEISDGLYTVLQAAISVAQDSGGAFDVTVGPLVNLWGFGPDRGAGVVPGADVLASARARVGVNKFALRADPNALQKRHPDVYIDLSGIAKGYAVDRVAAFLQSKGQQNFLVDIGGELRASGTNRNGTRWRIGIENPITDGREIGRTIALSNTGLASSGDYRNYFESGGVRYGHTIDPKTGAPAQHRLAAVTVLYPAAMIADAWATALMSMGFDEGIVAANKHNVAALFIVDEADNWKSYTTRAYDLAVGNH